MTQSTTDPLAQRLTHLRKNARLSQAALAARVGVSQSAISQLERGRRRPSLGLITGIAVALSCPLSDLVDNPGTAPLTKAEEDLLQAYRSLGPSARQQLQTFAEFLRDREFV